MPLLSTDYYSAVPLTQAAEKKGKGGKKILYPECLGNGNGFRK